MDVPVTAIDEVLEDFDCKIAKNEAKLLTGTKSTGKKGMRISIYINICFDNDSFMYIF